MLLKIYNRNITCNKRSIYKKVKFVLNLEHMKLKFFKKKLGLKSNQINKYEDQIEIHTIIWHVSPY